MPILNLKISGTENSELNQILADKITELTQNKLNKKPEVTAITISYIPEKNWFINKTSLDKKEMKSFYLDIKITDSTNLKNEKEEYIDSVFDFMNKTFENLIEESYIYIEEVKGDSYGYAGKTQEFRYHNKYFF